jgi:hypothetical protein
MAGRLSKSEEKRKAAERQMRSERLFSTQQKGFKVVGRKVQTLKCHAVCLKMFKPLSTEDEQNTTF